MIDPLLTAKADIAVLDRWGRSPLDLACTSACIEALLPLMHAASRGDKTILAQLLKNGENSLMQDRFGDTALHRAAVHGKANSVEIFIKGLAQPS